jgi:alkylation response protein AidB-like acyl-CoA dehydrogenase
MAIQFIPTEEQVMLRDGLRRWAAERDVREREDFESAWSFGAEQGWLMAGLPEDAGGLGGSAFDSAIIAEELGRGLVRAPFVEIGMVAVRILLKVSNERAADLALGTVRPLLAHDEPQMRGSRDVVETLAVAKGEGWLLSGRKTGLVGAPHADAFFVSARVADSGISLFEVAADGAPLRPFITIDDRAGGELLLVDTPATLVLGPGKAMGAVNDALDHALLLESAEALGAMQRVLEMTRDYLLTRKQYGQLIGDFQALRHRLADMFIEVEQARSIVLRGLDALNSTDVVQRGALAAAVKARVAQAGMFVGGQGIQLHGGIGVTDEYPVGHFFKRLLVFAQRHGGEARQVERYAELTAV